MLKKKEDYQTCHSDYKEDPFEAGNNMLRFISKIIELVKVKQFS